MATAATRNFLMPLVAGGLLLTAATLVGALSQAGAAKRGQAAERRVAMDAAFRRAAGELETFLFELDRFVLDAEPIGSEDGTDKGPSPTIVAAIQGALAQPTAPAGATATVYQDIDKDEVEVPFRHLGSAAADGAVPMAPLPIDVLWSELEHADATGGSSALVWFDALPGGGVRLNLAGTAMHEDTDAQLARLRLMHVSAPFTSPADVALAVRCDIVDGALAPALPRAAANGGEEGGGSDETLALVPAELSRMRWPVASQEPRAVVRYDGAGVPWLVYVLLLGGLFALGLAARALQHPPSEDPATASDPTLEEAPHD